VTAAVRIAFVLVVAAAAACRTVGGPTTLERRDVQHLTVETIDAAGEHFVHVSGVAMHSAMTVRRIETVTEDGTVRLRVLLAPAEKDQSGSFSVVVHVPATVRQVEFGDERDVVWPIAGVR
jgi:hypothetical protein